MQVSIYTPNPDKNGHALAEQQGAHFDSCTDDSQAMSAASVM